MLYQLTRILMTSALRLYYRRVFHTGVEIIPASGPVILLANHHASLMDAALLGVLLKRPIHYFTRGDIFNNKLAASMLGVLNMIPVYDHSGKKSINDNDASFSRAMQILRAGGIILFFPEGTSHVERRLKPLKKGAFRLAFQTFAATGFSEEILLVPIGINYAHPLHSETDVLIHFSTPLRISDYLPEFRRNVSAAILQLKKEAAAALAENVLHVEDGDRLSLVTQCLDINRNDDYFFTDHWLQATRKRFEEEKKICGTINAMDTKEAAAFARLVTEYFNQLHQLGITDELMSNRPEKTVRNNFLLILTFPLFAIAWLLNALPVLIAKRIADSKVKRPDFYSWVFVTSSALLYCVWILILFGGFAVIGLKYAAAIVLVTMVLGPYTIFFINKLNNTRREKIFQRLEKENSQLLVQLNKQRNAIKEIMFKSAKE